MANRSFVVAIDENNPKTKYQLMVEVPDGSGDIYKAVKTRQAQQGSKERMEQIAESRNSAERFDDIFYVESREDLDNAISLINSNEFAAYKGISLVTDIDLSGEEFIPIFATGSQQELTIDGQGHTILNMTVRKGCTEQSGTSYGGGFLARYDGKYTIKNIAFSCADVAVTQKAIEDQEDFSKSGNIVAVVAGYAINGATFENVTVLNSIVRGYGKIAGILGMSNPGKKVIFKNCAVIGTVLRGATNVSGLGGTLQRGETKEFNNVVVENCNVDVTWISDPNGTYERLDTYTDPSEECPTLPANFPVKGIYCLINGYWYAGFAKHYVNYGTSSHDCTLVGKEEKLADAEIIF